MTVGIYLRVGEGLERDVQELPMVLFLKREISLLRKRETDGKFDSVSCTARCS